MEIKTTPEKRSIKKIIKMVSFNKEEDKQLIIPLFQRDYVWNTNDETIPNLLYSLKNGFPIGNLTMWSKKLDGDKYENVLIDGLQRTFSIINILIEPWKYISHKLHKEEYQKICPTEIKIPEVIDEETSKIEHKITDRMLRQNSKLKKCSSIEEANKYLDNLNGKTKELKERDKFSSLALKNIMKWVSDEMENLEIIVNYIDNASQEQIINIFTLMNSNGKKLNKFEALSSKWSSNSISKENLELEMLNLIKKRDEQYCKILSKLESERNILYLENCKNSLREKSNNIIPSDYLNSFIHFIFNNSSYDSKLRKIYISNNNFIDNEISIYILMNLLNDANIKNKWDFDDFGKNLSKTINKNKKFTEESREKIIEAFKIIEKNFDLIQFMDSFSKSNDSKTIFDSLKISTHFVTSLINQVVSFKEKSSKLKKETIQLKLLETKIKTEYSFSSSPGEKSIKAYNDKFLIKNYSDKEKEDLLKYLKGKVFPENKTKKSFSDIDKIITLYTHSIHTSAKKENIHFDHIFPKSIIKNLEIEDNELINLINSYANSQVLSEGINIQKGNRFFPEELQYDTLKNDKNFNNLLNTNNIGENGYKDLISDLKEIKKINEN